MRIPCIYIYIYIHTIHSVSDLKKRYAGPRQTTLSEQQRRDQDGVATRIQSDAYWDLSHTQRPGGLLLDSRWLTVLRVHGLFRDPDSIALQVDCCIYGSGKSKERSVGKKMVDKFERIDDVITMMNSPAPPGVVEKLCQKLRDVETHEKNTRGDFIVNECRSHIFKQEDVKWMDVMVSAYVINGGIMIRDIIPPPPALEEAKTEEITQKNKDSSKSNNTTTTTAASSKSNNTTTTTAASSKSNNTTTTTAASSKSNNTTTTPATSSKSNNTTTTTAASAKTAPAKTSSNASTKPNNKAASPSVTTSSNASTNPTEQCNDHQVPIDTAAPSHEDAVLKEIESMIDNMGIAAVPS
jgi:hypothetical protein